MIDAAKAVAAVRGGRVAAIPTTLSGAEMTAIHRLPAGHEGISGVRPALVLADADLMTSLPEHELRATAMNALAHGADSLYTPLADDASRKNALRGAKLIATSLDAPPAERDRGDLALGSLLCAQAIDAAGLAIHHVMSQTTVRVCGTPHAGTNAAILPVAMAEMRERAPAEMEALADALGTDPAGLPERIEELGGGRRGLSDLGAERACIDPVLDAAMARPELEHMTPGEVTRDDLGPPARTRLVSEAARDPRRDRPELPRAADTGAERTGCEGGGSSRDRRGAVQALRAVVGLLGLLEARAADRRVVPAGAGLGQDAEG